MKATLHVYNIINGKKTLVNVIEYNEEAKIYQELVGCYKRKVEKTNKVTIYHLPYDNNTIKASITFERHQCGGLYKTIFEYVFEGVKIS